MKTLRIAGLIGFIIIFGLTLMVSGQETVEEICIPMGSFYIEPPEDVTAKRASVDFPHSRHFDYSCKTCHHKWDYEGPILGCTTSGCHDGLEPPKKVGTTAEYNELSMRYYKNAYHDMCLGCHKSIKKQNILAERKLRFTDKDTKLKKAGPLTCKNCHPEE
ncbi:MAG: cytochrome c3 family protein [Deltaproteobacteria bacterium]|nr:cytochrome c3 family protein [Deltaproteobacteria bacterium]MBW1960282.1 cytochrome c3 family protein [Deltaproteobacteria bacterium]MBW2150304.1 cytochrome c3 family protein [Deltaproteobacteria bacterium]